VKTILGISAFYHDSAAAIIKNGKVVAAAQEERFSRIKHDPNFPKKAIEFVLSCEKKEVSELDAIVFYEKPFLKFERLLETYVACAPKGFMQFSKAMPIWIKEKLFQKRLIIESLKEIDPKFNSLGKIFFTEHHFSHAASAFYPSPFSEAIVLTADGVGEWATTTISLGTGKKLEILKEINFPHSLGLLYSAFTYYIGFKVNSGEYKLMGLAPYGKPIFTETIKNNLVKISSDGSFWLNQKYFNYMTGFTMINKNFEKLFGQKKRNPKTDPISQFHMDIAASIQKVTEDIMIMILKKIKTEYQIDNLCLAGGVALNCVANGKILKNKLFKNIWIQPAAGDAGGSIGAALALWNQETIKEKRLIEPEDSMSGSLLGPEFKNDHIENLLNEKGVIFERVEDQELLIKTAQFIANGDVVGWFQGKMEFGPRALGCRSILGDPRSIEMQKKINLNIKFRESFRPFAPAILEEELSDWFDIELPSPYMLFVGSIKDNLKLNIDKNSKMSGIEKLNIKRSEVPAVTHVDFSARLQTVNKNQNLKFYNLIKEFKNLTGCPMVINTSFNVRGEPIVCTPNDALRCFMGTHMDRLVIGNFLIDKKKQKVQLKTEHHKKFELD
tara:strand:+ start:2188 stop:4026 length:1839 start_codon:yes stop_codon:yes gene_type:complete